MPPLAVDPAALSGAGAAVISAGDGVAAATGALTSGFGANTGQDAAGEAFGLAYQDTAKSVLKAAATGINACRITGFKVEAGASNYSRAEAASTLGGGGAVLPTPTPPGNFDAPGAPWTLGPGIAEPALWALVEAFVGDMWPNGNPAQIHAAAACWRTFGAALDGVKDVLHGPSSVIAAQQVPEGGLIQQVFSKLGDDMAKIGDECDKLAKGLDDFANEVQHAQDAIRDLLHRLDTPSGLWHEAVELFKGHGLDEIKKIANDIKAVLHNMKREADAKEQLFQQAMGLLDGCAVGLEAYARKELTHFLGDDVGSVASGYFDAYVDISEGTLKGAADMADDLSQLNPMRFAYDPKGAMQTWEGVGKLAEMAANPAAIPAMIASDPKGMLDMVKGLVDYKDWSSDRPLVGLGHNLFDIGSVVLPGVGEVGAGTKAAEVAGAASRAADAADAADVAGAVGRDGRVLGEAGEFASATGTLSDVTKTAGELTKDLEKVGSDFPRSDPPLGGRPAGLPPPKPGEPPVGPLPRPVESTPPVSSRPPGDPPAAPVPGTTERAVVPSPNEHPPAPTPGEHLPPTNPQLAEPTPARVPVSPDGVPAEPAPAAAHAPQSAPGFAAPTPHPAPIPHPPPADMPHLPADARPPEPPHDGALGDPGGGGAPAGHPPEPPSSSDGSPHGADDGAPPHHPSDHTGGDADNDFYPPGSLPSYDELQDLTKTNPDKAYYWSGRDASGAGVGPDGSGIAEHMAAEANGTTLEMTLEKNGLDPLPRWNEEDPESVRFWTDASSAYAANASGTVTAIIGRNLRPGNIWQVTEIPRLMENPNVTQIIQIDPDTGEATVIFER